MTIVQLINIIVATPDRVIWLATLFHRGLWREILRILQAVVGSKVSVRRLPAGIGMVTWRLDQSGQASRQYTVVPRIV
jgi:hypothetical protein